MGTSERRKEIVRILCCRRHETVSNLAIEFGVSERTIRRDIEVLSLTEPIYTQTGRYAGGIYVVDGYYNKEYMTNDEISLLCRLADYIKTNKNVFSKLDIDVLNKIINKYKKPEK